MNLKLHSKGPAVERLQRRLVEMGFDAPVSGTFDHATRDAVMEFQTSAGLSADGIAGPRTAQALGMVFEDESATGSPTANPQLKPHQVSDVVFDEEDVFIDKALKEVIEDCAKLTVANTKDVLDQTLVAINQFETAMARERVDRADSAELSKMVSDAFWAGIGVALAIASGPVATAIGATVITVQWFGTLQDTLVRKAEQQTSASVTDWILLQRRIISEQKESLGELTVRDVTEEIETFYLDSGDKSRAVDDIFARRDTLRFAPRAPLEDLELTTYEAWIRAHYIGVRNDGPGCLEYRFEIEAGVPVFKSLKVDAPETNEGNLGIALNSLFQSGKLTLATEPIDMFVKKRIFFRAPKLIGESVGSTGWLDEKNDVLHVPTLDEEAARVLERTDWRRPGALFR
ncbi:peptidoglycan-binding domain-containing protein [Demequina subtropica]|uniref:peptidoglycan-binding domain-containing protein n=1 Tax=Demequina subtropica TaxID=1638989 RepID=UPI000785EDC2|nr:peptidoglycan-binding domain-containing protein [Demequina subtropica]